LPLSTEPQPKSNLVHFSHKIRHLVATILMIFLRVLPKIFLWPHYSGAQKLGTPGSLNRLNPRFLRHWGTPETDSEIRITPSVFLELCWRAGFPIGVRCRRHNSHKLEFGLYLQSMPTEWTHARTLRPWQSVRLDL